MQSLKHLARGRLFVDGAIPKARARSVDQRFNLWIIDPTDQKAQRIAEQRKRETRQLPGADVAGKKDDATATLARGVEMLDPFAFNHTFESLRAGCRELTEHSKQPAQIFKTPA